MKSLRVTWMYEVFMISGYYWVRDLRHATVCTPEKCHWSTCLHVLYIACPASLPCSSFSSMLLLTIPVAFILTLRSLCISLVSIICRSKRVIFDLRTGWCLFFSFRNTTVGSRTKSWLLLTFVGFAVKQRVTYSIFPGYTVFLNHSGLKQRFSHFLPPLFDTVFFLMHQNSRTRKVYKKSVISLIINAVGSSI